MGLVLVLASILFGQVKTRPTPGRSVSCRCPSQEEHLLGIGPVGSKKDPVTHERLSYNYCCSQVGFEPGDFIVDEFTSLLTLYEALVHWVLSSDKSCLRRFRANTDDRES